MVMNRTQPFMLQPLQFTQMPIEKPLRGLPLHQCGVDIRFVLRRPTSHIQPEPVRLPPAALRFPAIRHIAISLHTIQCMRHRNEAFTHQPIEHNNKQSHRQRLSATRYSQNQESLFFPLISLCFSHPVV